MAEPSKTYADLLRTPLNAKEQLRAERMSAAAGKPLPSCTPTGALRPWRGRAGKAGRPTRENSLKEGSVK